MLIIVDENTDTVSICGMDWSDVFFLGSLLINESAKTKVPEIRYRSDHLLEAIESAAESIF